MIIANIYRELTMCQALFSIFSIINSFNSQNKSYGIGSTLSFFYKGHRMVNILIWEADRVQMFKVTQYIRHKQY